MKNTTQDTINVVERQSAPTTSGTNMPQPINILMIEDDDFYFRFVEKILSQPRLDVRFSLVPAYSLADAERCIGKNMPDVILLDLSLPDSTGLETLEKLREIAGTAPIIILTARDDEKLGIQSVAKGAQDYLIKQRISSDSIVRSIRYAITRRKSELAQLRLGAIKDFCAALAHDLQVPLVGSRNLLDAMLNDPEGAGAQREGLLALRKSNGEQLVLIQRLLEIYRYESHESELQFAPTYINSVIDRCLKKLSLQISSHGMEIKTKLPADLHLALGDDEALEHVFTNLLDNAIKFGTHCNKVEVTAKNTDDALVIEVRSFGKVISVEDQRLLFQGFWQGVPGKKYVAYTGLGLYLCHHLVDLHGGKITCESSVDNGTTFTVTLPAASHS
jgi:signal transduction histidine kinase